MANKKKNNKSSIFEDSGFSSTIDFVKQEIQELYLSDEVPWVIGYSGGKDSTACLQLTWLALSELPEEKRQKPIYPISTDTLVENPIVSFWVRNSHKTMEKAAKEQGMPFKPQLLIPAIEDTFWVNLIGKGYPAPRHKFRWCTERLKINPSNKFVRDMVRENGEAVLVLGTRIAESSNRSRTMAEHRKNAIRERLVPSASMVNTLIYTPIEDWSNDDVWTFLMRSKNPWGHNNKDLMTMYRGASADGECPLVVDNTTPSCGNSRFGCWVCTMVEKDKSMDAMIQNDQEKEWMAPLLDLRNELDFRSEDDKKRDRSRRDFRRFTGKLNHYTDANGEFQLVPGPYVQDTRAYWLERLLETQQWIRENGPEEVRDIELITLEELEEIRRIWVVDKHEIEDLLPKIYIKIVSEKYPGNPIDDNLIFDDKTLEILKETCNGDELHFELARNLLDIERRYRTLASRKGLFLELEKALERCFYDNVEDARNRAKFKAGIKQTEIKMQKDEPLFEKMAETT